MLFTYELVILLTKFTFYSRDLYTNEIVTAFTLINNYFF